jgi:AcrR family transcriptional regulator
MKQNRGRPRKFDRDKVLKLAMEQFWEYGYENTSIELLLPIMGINKSSFYNTFKSKEELFYEVIFLYRDMLVQELLTVIEDIGTKDALIFLSRYIVDEYHYSHEIKSCLLVRSSQEFYGKNKELSRKISFEYNYLLNLYSEFIYEAQQKGEIKRKRDSRLIASRYLNAINSLRTNIQIGVSDEILEDILDQIKSILK